MSIPQYNIANIAHSKAIHQDSSAGHVVNHLAGLAVQGNHIAGIDQHCIILVNAHELSQFLLRNPVSVFAVYRYCKLRMDQGID